MGVEDERRRLGGAFAQGGADYERLRPTYPREAVEWMLAGAPEGIVADVGAGTGKLTQVVAALGREVVAIEPSLDMVGQLRATWPDVSARQGSGERTGLDAGSAAAVVYGQAWHWVEPVAGTAEAARILVPGGVLGMIWNYMDTGDPAIAALDAAMHVLDPGPGEHSDSSADVGVPFRTHETRTFRWDWPITTAGLADLVTTRSYYLARPEAERADIRRAVSATVEEHFGPIGDTTVRLAQRTEVHRWVRP